MQNYPGEITRGRTKMEEPDSPSLASRPFETKIPLDTSPQKIYELQWYDTRASVICIQVGSLATPTWRGHALRSNEVVHA